ncbi:hypothetical protein KEM56_007437 [Ascosphaera pollenicola]|nr:hypothetical protein KEM56_007437 [Ascosphaera pollenicola]
MSLKPCLPALAPPALNVESYLNALKQRRADFKRKRTWHNGQCPDPESQGIALTTRAVTVKTGNESFQPTRHRVPETCAGRQKTVTNSATSGLKGRPRTLAADALHGIDCYDDAMVCAQGKGSDDEAFEQMYGFPVEAILEMGNSYMQGIRVINTHAMVSRRTDFPETFFHQIEFAFMRFSYRLRFWIRRDQLGRSLFKNELDDAVMRFWRVYDAFNTV